MVTYHVPVDWLFTEHKAAVETPEKNQQGGRFHNPKYIKEYHSVCKIIKA